MTIKSTPDTELAFMRDLAVNEVTSTMRDITRLETSLSERRKALRRAIENLSAFDTIAQVSPGGLLDLLKQVGFAASTSEAKRLVVAGAVTIDGETLTDWQSPITITDGMTLRAGIRKVCRLKVKNPQS